MLNELFVNNGTTKNVRSLPGSMELVALSNSFAEHIIKSMEADAENYKDRIIQSGTDSAVLNGIIDELLGDYGTAADFLKDLGDDIVDGILKSQQSKRSRSKSLPMTLDNYRSYMSAAIAEKLIREVTGRTRTYARSNGPTVVDFTPEQLEALAEDQNELRRHIRNIQSRKSIAKAKDDFDEGSEYYVNLCKVEQQLKDLRISDTTTKIVEVDETRNALTDLLTDVDISKLNSKDAHELLSKIADMTKES